MPSWSNQPSGTMTAAVLTSPGAHPPSLCFSIDHAYPKPTLPSEDWVLVRVKAVGLNRAELRGRNKDVPGPGEFGIFRSEYHEDPPKILGEEFVGIIETAGSSTSFKPGDHVAGWIYGGGKAHDGAYAQYTICHSRRCFPLPRTTLPWPTLGSIFMSMWTAWGSLFEAAQLTLGSTLLIHGATSSVGLWAILLAKSHSCTVLATTRQASKTAKLKQAGADHVLLEADLATELKTLYPNGVDCILELVGPENVLALDLPSLARHGTAVITGVLSKTWTIPDFTPSQIPATRKLTFYSMGETDEGLDKVPGVMESVVKKVEEGVWREEVFVSRVFDGLEEVGEAHEFMEGNGGVGKAVIVVE